MVVAAWGACRLVRFWENRSYAPLPPTLPSQSVRGMPSEGMLSSGELGGGKHKERRGIVAPSARRP
jgi:hypothetical protein